MNRVAPSMAVLVTGSGRARRLQHRRHPRRPTPAATSATSQSPRRPQRRRRHRRSRATTTSAVAYPAADVCTYLTGQIPALTAIGSPVGVQANLAGNLFGFFQSHGIPADGAQLDDATKAQCPDVRSQILVLSGLTSFTQL